MHDHSQPQNTADSAGFPWEGRSFSQHSDAFANDSGEIPAELASVLERFRQGTADHAEVLEVFASARVLIPLLTVAGDVGVTPEGKTVDKTQELSIVTVQAPDGRSVLPVFSSVDAMRRWNPDARPVPNFGRQVAVAALDDNNDLVILDPTSETTQFGIRRPALWALAEGTLAPSCWLDDEVMAAFRASIEAEPHVASVELSAGDPEATLSSPELSVMLTLQPGLTQDSLDELLSRLQHRWSESDVIAHRVDSMSLKLRS